MGRSRCATCRSYALCISTAFSSAIWIPKAVLHAKQPAPSKRKLAACNTLAKQGKSRQLRRAGQHRCKSTRYRPPRTPQLQFDRCARLLRTEISKGVPESSKSFEGSSSSPEQHGWLQAPDNDDVARGPQARARARRRAAERPSRRRDAHGLSKTREGGARALGEPRRVPRGARAPGAARLWERALLFEASRVTRLFESVTRHACSHNARLFVQSGHRQSRPQAGDGLGNRRWDVATGRPRRPPAPPRGGGRLPDVLPAVARCKARSDGTQAPLVPTRESL